MFEGIMDRCPSVARLFWSLYRQPSKLYLSLRVFIGESQTGVRQSFSLTMMFFCLGIQPMLQRMERAILTLQEGFHSPLPAGVVAYAADIYACISDLALAPRSILVGISISTTMALKQSSSDVLYNRTGSFVGRL